MPFCFSQAFSSQSDILTNFEARPFFVSTESGWDFFAVPDLFVGHRLGWAAAPHFYVNGGFYWAFFPTKNITRAASADIRLVWTVYDGESMIIQPFLYTSANFGSVFYESAYNTKCGTGYEVNPRADSMISVQNGFFYYLHPANSKRFALTGKVQSGYSFASSLYVTEVRIKYGYSSIFSCDTHINMFAVLTDFLSLELQNKFSYNEKKGLTYSISPMIYLFRNTPFILSIGGQIPLEDADYWSVSASIAYSPPAEEKKTETPKEIPSYMEDQHSRNLTSFFIYEQDSSELFPDNEEYSTRNKAALEEVLAFIRESEEYIIHLEGHANRADFTKGYTEEQEKELMPLSIDRVNKAKQALIDNGIDENLITTEASGAEKPVVPFLDANNSWKNRRVEITVTRLK